MVWCVHDGGGELRVVDPGAHAEELGWVHPNPALFDNRCWTFVARDVVQRTAGRSWALTAGSTRTGDG